MKSIHSPHPKSPEEALETVRKLLLSTDRQELSRLSAIIDEDEKLSERITPIILEHLEILKKEFPTSYKMVVLDMIDQRLHEQRDEIIRMIYPELGLMIRKYIQLKFLEFQEIVEQQLAQAFFRQGRQKQPYSTRSHNEQIVVPGIRLGNIPKVEEVYVIEHNSGLLIASASNHEVIDHDLIGGMLTAIKAFGEDAFRRDQEKLTRIDYEDYRILMFNFYHYFTAVAVKGVTSPSFQDDLEGRLLNFAREHLRHDLRNLSPRNQAQLAESLHKTFIYSEEDKIK